MVPREARGGSCWTCRLRRKGCDGTVPTCASCRVLEIPCWTGKERPSWMDGASGKQQMSEIVKMKIKENALHGRERRLLVEDDQTFVITSAPDVLRAGNDVPFRNSAHSSDAQADIVSKGGIVSTTPRSNVLEISTISHSPVHSEPSQPLLLHPKSQIESAIPISAELGSIMAYLDHVFPFFYPYYQPSLSQTGRQWILGLLYQNQASFHIAASLSAYFYTLVAQNDEEETQDDCKALVRDRLLEQMGKALEDIQVSVSALYQHISCDTVLNRVRIMQEVTQLLVVEVVMRRGTNWMMHLDPAITLFEELCQTYGRKDEKLCFSNLLNSLPSPFSIPISHHKPLPYTADQTALLFFVALLLSLDIIASTTHGRSPVLQRYHPDLLALDNVDESLIPLESVAGCQDWALLAVGNIAALCEYKREMKQQGNLSVADLVKASEPITETLEGGLDRLEGSANRTQQEPPEWLPAYYSLNSSRSKYKTTALVTRVWARAAGIFLLVTLSGWQPNATQIQINVGGVLNLLRTIESPAQLRSLAWPFCIAGCMALPENEHEFRQVALRMGPLLE